MRSVTPLSHSDLKPYLYPPPPQVLPRPSPSCRPEIRPEHPLPGGARQQPVCAGMPTHPQPHLPTSTPTHTRRQHTPAPRPRATHSPAPRVAPLPAQHVGEGWGGVEARQGGLLEGWAGLELRGGRGSRAPLTAAPPLRCARRVHRGRRGDVAVGLCVLVWSCFCVQSRVDRAPALFGPCLGGARPFVFALLLCCPPPPAPVSAHVNAHVIYNVGSSIYIISVLVCHSLTHPMTRAARPDRFQPSRGDGNSIGRRFPPAAGPVLAQGGVTVSRLIG